MNKNYFVSGLLLVVCGCESMNNTQSGMLGGGIIGTALGAIVGGASGRPGTGALVGAAAGTTLGGLAGASQDRREERADMRAHAQAQALATPNPVVSLQEIVQLTHQHTPENIIINQITSTNSTYDLTVGDIQYLRANGVSDRIIQTLQARRPPAVVQHVRPVPATRVYHVYDPYPPSPPVSVGVGVGYGWDPHHHCWH